MGITGRLHARHGSERGELTIGATLPADFLTGIALHLISTLLRRNAAHPEPHSAALGTGALAACAYRYGERLGASMRRASTVAPPPPAAPALPSASSPRGETFTVTLVPEGGGRPTR